MARTRDFTRVGVSALVIGVALGFLALHAWWTIADSSREQSRINLVSAVVPDVTPATRVSLSGNVRVIGLVGDREPAGRDQAGAMTYREGCEALCAALLAMPAVTSVTVAQVRPGEELADISSATRFRLVRRAACGTETVKPQDPDRLGDRQGRGDTLAAAWALRLSTEDCIVAEPAKGAPDVTIASYSYTRFSTSDDWHWTLRPLGVGVQRLDILDSAGKVRFRRSHAATAMISRPLHPGIVGVKGLAMPVFGWARTQLTNDSSSEGLDIDRLILRHTDLRPTRVTEGLAAKIRARIEAAVKDSALPASDTAFDLVDGWIRGLPARLIDTADRALLVALIRDKRVTAFGGMWDVTRKLGADANLLRDPILRRIDRDGAAPDAETHTALRALSAQLPLLPRSDASFALEQAILRDPAKRLSAKGLIILQADRGAAAVPLLLNLLRHAAAAQGSRSRYDVEVVDGVQMALCRIGPAAGAAVPELRRLTAEGRISLADDDNWKIMLARIGTPLPEIGKPRGLQTTQADYEKKLARALSAGDRRCRESWE